MTDEEVIEKLREIFKLFDDWTTMHALITAEVAVHHLIWVPVSDRLPLYEGWYLVTARNDFGEVREMVTWFTPENPATGSPAVWGNYSKAGRWKNLAWMELPEPYEEVKE